ncbi:MAG: hypothetical protein LBJ67_00805 [Planctomycetaceae bacterium]|jgi:hypothetical protein|nr:hypothetical protein [Planctomycetaceae bacterium]
MPLTHDWLPKNHEALYAHAIVAFKYLFDTANSARLGFALNSKQWEFLTDWGTKLDAFQAAIEDWRDPAQRTPVKTEKLREAERVFKDAYRTLYTGFLKESPFVTDDDLLAMGLPKRNTTHTPAPVATTYPDFDIDRSTLRRLTIHFYDQGKEKSKAKPNGQHGAEIRWAILDSPPTKLDDLVHSSFDTHTPFTLEFDEDQRGKTVYFALRWENTRGEKGPWGEIESAIIP